MRKAWRIKLKELQLASRWHCFSYEKQCHLPAECNTSILWLQAFDNSHNKISILEFPRLKVLLRYNFWHEIKKILHNFGNTSQKLTLICLKNPSLHWRNQDHNYSVIITHLHLTFIWKEWKFFVSWKHFQSLVTYINFQTK